MKRGQVSIEFLTVFGFVFLMTLPLIIIFFDQSGNVQDSISENQIRNIAIRITDKAETIYYAGEPSKTTVKAYFPENIESITITNRTVIFSYRTQKNTIQNIEAVSLVKITGNLSCSTGVHNIEIQSAGEVVSIRER